MVPSPGEGPSQRAGVDVQSCTPSEGRHQEFLIKTQLTQQQDQSHKTILKCTSQALQEPRATQDACARRLVHVGLNSLCIQNPKFKSDLQQQVELVLSRLLLQEGVASPGNPLVQALGFYAPHVWKLLLQKPPNRLQGQTDS